MRIRTIKPEFWLNEKMARLPEFTRLLAIGLLNYADDHGYFAANPLLIRGAIFPFLDDSTTLLGCLQELSAIGFLELRTDQDGRLFGWVVNFDKHQRVDKAKASVIADRFRTCGEFVDASSTLPGCVVDESPKEQGTGKGNREGEQGTEGMEAKASSTVVDSPLTVATTGLALPMKGGYWEVDQRCLDRWRSVYGDRVEVDREIAKACVWLEDRPTKQPRSPRGCKQFMSRWLNGADEDARRSARSNGKSSGKLAGED